MLSIIARSSSMRLRSVEFTARMQGHGSQWSSETIVQISTINGSMRAIAESVLHQHSNSHPPEGDYATEIFDSETYATRYIDTCTRT